MFSSSGLFAGINCPFLKRGLCARPHCLYKHAAELRDVFGASCQSSMIDSAGVQNGDPGFGETKDDSLQELERINKEIETVRYEVEQEQRRLSRYQTVLADSIKTPPSFPVSKSETGGKRVDRGRHGLSSCTDLPRTYSRGKKYVVDNSKPRTDLEYDPLSNFSAGLRSYSSSAKEQKVKNRKCLKRAKNAVPRDQILAVAYQFPLSRSPSPEPLDDSNEDGDLIIDVPPSPEKKRARVQQPVDSVADKSLQQKPEVKTEPVSLLNVDACEETTAVYSNCSAENNQGPFNLYESKECENAPDDRSVVHLSGYLEDVQTESQKITRSYAEQLVEKSPEPESPPAATDQQDHNCNNLLVKKEENVFQVELPHCVGNMNPLQPHHFPPNNSLFYEAPGANSDSPCRQHATQVQAAQNRVSNQRSSVLPQSQKLSSKMQKGLFQGQAAAPEGDPAPVEPAPVDSSASSSANGAESSSASTGQLFLTEDNEEVILISSSSDEDELNYSEMELSDSDPMEECYRIFMEANEEKGNEEQPDVSVGTTDVEEKPKLNVKPPNDARKEEVAHDAKHTEQPVAKSRPQPQVLVPLRSPAVSGFASTTSKIQQVQQRASMLTASVKGGQAFVVSSTCQRKPETQNASLPSTQTPENMQPAPVQNAHMNYISLGTAVIGVDNNLHLILPEGLFPLPVTSASSQVASVLTPNQSGAHEHRRRETNVPCPAATPPQRYRTTAPVLIPAPARKPSLTFALSHSSPAASAAPQAAVHTAVKPVPTKRKLKQSEATKEKVPHEIRQRYVNMFTEEFLKTTANVNEAFEKALAEEKAVYNRSVNKLKYLSVAVNALKRLKNQSAVTAKGTDTVLHEM
ncbi:LOW QUALITY PROTEIN: RNA exonuclease 1 homolog [Cebidichthys violaceus]|uniref:LOW QUALITY PROTEIN: RNA exonuclease 1 homolog n=1 Tax=Cebidichthys violaceus TaxID=271503 RepID=UPI0035C9655F